MHPFAASPSSDRAAPPARGAAAIISVTAVLIVLTGTGCKGIDKSQWSTVGSSERATTGSSSDGGTSVTSQQTISINGSSGDLGVTSGSGGGAPADGRATAIVQAAPDVCWVLTLDGNNHRGCGNASLTDTRGAAAARITKTSGSGTIRLILQSGGRTVDSGTVTRVSRYVTVAGARG